MNKKRINDIYQFMSNARMSKLSDDEKVTVIKLLRQMKPVAVSVQEAAHDAVATARAEYPDDQQKATELFNKSMADILNQEVDIDLRVLTDDAFGRLCLSNDWTFAQMDELESELVTSKTNIPA